MRRLIDFLLNLYFIPLRANKRLLLYAKGKLISGNEHLLVTIDVLRRRFPNDKGLIVDAGAFDGDSTLILARTFPENTVIGFEPSPSTYKRACTNVAHFSNVKMVNQALADKNGTADFYLTNDAVSSSLFKANETKEFASKEKIVVNVVTLDDYFADTPQEILLLKLDVQGAEERILKGGSKVLSRTKAVLTEVLVADLYEGSCKYYEVDELLRRNGFRLYTTISNYNNEGTKYFDVLYLKSKLIN